MEKEYILTFCDRITTEDILNVVNETEVDKILAVMINKYENKKIEEIISMFLM